MKVFTLGTLIAQIDVSVVKGSTGPNRVREMLPSLSVITFHESNEKHVTCQARGGRLIEIWPQHADLSHRRRPIEEQENGTEAQETCGRNTDTRDERTCAPYQDSVSHSPTLPHSHPSPGTNFQNRGLPKYRDREGDHRYDRRVVASLRRAMYWIHGCLSAISIMFRRLCPITGIVRVGVVQRNKPAHLSPGENYQMRIGVRSEM